MGKKDTRTDKQLHHDWREGDASAGEVLVERHYQSISRFFTNKIGSMEAYDLAQETFLGLRKNVDRFQGKSSVRTLLFSIARNKLCDFLRAKNAKREEQFDPDKSTLEGSVPSLPSLIDRNEQQRLLLRSLRKLPVNTLLIFELFYWQDMSVKEIGEAIGMNHNTVKTKLARGRSELMKLIEIHADSPEISESTQRWLEGWAKKFHDKLDPNNEDLED